MKPQTPPIILVRHVGTYVEYYIQQGNHRVNFFLDLEQHEALKRAQEEADAASQKPAQSPFSLRVVGQA